jgi:hypothetical protein
VEVFDSSGEEVVASTAATLGAETTFDADSGVSQDDRRIANLTAIVGFTFLGDAMAINAALQIEAVKLVSLPASGACQIQEEFKYDYAAADVFESPEVTFTVTAPVSGKVGINYRARFIATMPDGSVEVEDVIFDVVNSRLEQPITDQNITDYDPNLLKLVPSNLRGTRWKAQLVIAWDAVYQDLVTEKLIPHRYMDHHRLAMVHFYKFKVILSENGYRIGEEEFPLQHAKHFRAVYRAELDDAVKQSSWYEHVDDLKPGAGGSEQQPGWRGLRL